MPAIQRQGDANSAGGTASGGEPSVRINGQAVVVPNISVTPHRCGGTKPCSRHRSAKTAGGSTTVRVAGKPVIRATVDTDTCGHPRTGGSPDVRTP